MSQRTIGACSSFGVQLARKMPIALQLDGVDQHRILVCTTPKWRPDRIRHSMLAWRFQSTGSFFLWRSGTHIEHRTLWRYDGRARPRRSPINDYLTNKLMAVAPHSIVLIPSVTVALTNASFQPGLHDTKATPLAIRTSRTSVKIRITLCNGF